MLLVLLLACRADDPAAVATSADTSSPPATDSDVVETPWDCLDLTACFSPTVVRLATTHGALVGYDIGVMHDANARLVVSAPNQANYVPDTGNLALVALIDADPTEDVIEVPSARAQILANPVPRADGSYPPHVTRMGSALVLPGDVTGDGVPDLVTLSDATAPSVPGIRVFPGPFGPPGPDALFGSAPDYANHPSVAVGPVGTSIDGARCGDLDGDGVDDLVLDDGIVLGPIVAGQDEPLARDHALGGSVFEIDSTTSGCVWLTNAGDVRRLSGISATGPATTPLFQVTGATTAGHFMQVDGEVASVVALTEGGAHRVESRATPTADPVIIALPREAGAVLRIDLDGNGSSEILVGMDAALSVYDDAGVHRGTWTVPNRGTRPPTFRLKAADVGGGPERELLIAHPRGGLRETGEVFVLSLPLPPPAP